MSEKKQPIGKKTKLAKLALARALKNKGYKVPESPHRSDPDRPSLSQAIQVLRQWQLPIDHPFPFPPGDSPSSWYIPSLGYSYFQLIQDLRHIQELLHPAGLPTAPRKAPKGRLILPTPEIFQELIRLTVTTLRELKSLMD